MKRKVYLVLSISCFLTAFLLMMTWNRAEDESLAARIAPQILRFHVLANSNRTEDQELKLEVRTLLLNTIYEELGQDASLLDTKEYIGAHTTELEERAEQYMADRGYDYLAHIELTNCYFPTKAYGDMVFPCGYYDAARVLIGSGRGRNWWCVLYPQLCFVDSTYAVVPRESKMKLETSIGEKDYQSLLDARPQIMKQAGSPSLAGSSGLTDPPGLADSSDHMDASGGEIRMAPTDHSIPKSAYGSAAGTQIQVRFKLWDWITKASK